MTVPAVKSVRACPGGEFGLYLHIPYCDSKCPYCDFNSHAAQSWPEQRYVAALLRELDEASALDPWRGATLTTVFFGGGTPSLFRPDSIAEVMAAIDHRWRLAADAEVTLEANPGTVDAGALAAFRDAGVNRLSLGVQSFHDATLEILGRIHDAATAIGAVEDARAAGFDNINVDLMFAIPGQTLAQWRADLQRVVDLGTAHVSAYNLTFEEGTVFHAMRRRGELAPVGEFVEIAMYDATEECLSDAGFERYEISNYARRGRVCRHNLTYWRSRPYLGVGAGAHSFVPLAGAGRRWSNALAPQQYMRDVEKQGHARISDETLDEQRARGELAFLGLRCREGFDEKDLDRRFGVGVAEAFPHCLHLEREGLLERDGTRWRLSGRGWMIADEIFAMFV